MTPLTRQTMIDDKCKSFAWVQEVGGIALESAYALCTRYGLLKYDASHLTVLINCFKTNLDDALLVLL